MKTISKPTRDIAVSACSLLSLGLMIFSPVATFALGPKDAMASDATTTPKTSEFCSTTLAKDASKITTNLNNLIGKANDAWSGKNTKWSTIWANVDTEVSTDRQKADTARQQDFTKLQAKATTSTEQQAVQAYETAVNNAVNTRRAAYDAARQTFRAGVEAAISGRQNTVTGQYSTFEAAVNTAIQNAQASCASNPSNGQEIRTTLEAALKSARESFQGDRKSDSTVGSQVQQLITTRDAAFKSADQAFQNSMTSAAQALKQAFGSNSSSV
jgi:hypothetical protein